jgi:hypothetical protein
MVLLWPLLMTLWLPWFDDGSGYGLLFHFSGERDSAQHGVIVSQGLGESERALLEYYAGIRTRRFELDRYMKGADLFLIECGSEGSAR